MEAGDWISLVLSILSFLTLLAIFVVVIFEYRVNKRPVIVAFHFLDRYKQLLVRSGLVSVEGKLPEKSPYIFGRGSNILFSDRIIEDITNKGRLEQDNHQYLLIENRGGLAAEDVAVIIHYHRVENSGAKTIINPEADEVLYVRSIPSGAMFFVPCLKMVDINGSQAEWGNEWTIIYQTSHYWRTRYFLTTKDDADDRRKSAFGSFRSRKSSRVLLRQQKKSFLIWFSKTGFTESQVGRWVPTESTVGPPSETTPGPPSETTPYLGPPR